MGDAGVVETMSPGPAGPRSAAEDNQASMASLSLPQRAPMAGLPRAALWIALAYFAAHVALRVAVSPAPELDEAEQLLWTRELAWGYGAQPPLYTWLQWAVFEALGVSMLGLALLKNALLLATYVALAWAAAPLVGGSAALLAASMLWLPQIGWESQRDLTHTVLATTCAATALALFVRIACAPRRWHYVAFGAVVGLGVLAKYNLVVFHALLVGTALALPELRPRILTRRTLLAVAVALAVVAPHAVWALQHLDEVTGGTARKMGLAPDGGVAARLGGVGSAAAAAASVVAPWVLAFGILVAWPTRRAARGARPGATDPRRALARRAVGVYAVLLAAALAAMALAGGVTHFKGRWLQPMLFAVPLAGWLLLPAPASAAVERRFARATAALALVLLAAIGLRAPLDGWRGEPDELNEPVAALAARIRELEPRPATLVVAPSRLAAAMRLQFPEARVLRADEPGASTARGATVHVAAGDADAVRRLAGRADAPVHELALRPLYARDDRRLRRYAIVVSRD